MKVQTSTLLPMPPDKVWPLLCQSHMDEQIPCLFRLGIPKPVECRLPSGKGGVGEQRQCISNQGVIYQQITQWQENQRLQFEMKDTDMYFGKCVTSIKEQFDLIAIGENQTQLTRTTEYKVNGFCQIPKSILLWIGLKNVHRYVFRNWANYLSQNNL